MSAPKPVAMNDLGRQSAALAGPIGEAVRRVVESGWYILGNECKAFEEEFAAYLGAANCVGVGNGTDALELALRAVGIGPGDRVATVANAGGYSTTAIRAAGAVPLYVDIDADNMNMSAGALAAAIPPDTRAVIVTHLYGRMADLPALLAVADRAGIPLIEDCAQAHGASLDGRKAGTWGAMGCFSFYPTKNLGALGDGGAVTTNDAALAGRVKSLRQYGWSGRYRCAEYGRNSRLDEMQAAILRVKLPYLDGWNARRRAIAAAYSAALAGTGLRGPNGRATGQEACRTVAHLYVVRCARRDAARDELGAEGIATDIHYPVPDHLQEAAPGAGADLPVTEKAAREILTLPCHSELHEDEVARVVQALKRLRRGHMVGAAPFAETGL